MDAKRLWYWVTTAWVVGIMTITGGLSVAHAKTMMEGFAHLGYPAYFANLLGVAKLLGACALLVPGFARIFARTREWAYAGFAIVIVSASYSHLFSGDGLKSLEPLATLAALAVSYWTRPADRSFNFHSARFDAAMPPEAAR
jgi:DoxX-like family